MAFGASRSRASTHPPCRMSFDSSAKRLVAILREADESPEEKITCIGQDSGIGIVVDVFMVDGPSIKHDQKAIPHKSCLMGRQREFYDGGPERGPGYGLHV